MTGHLYHSLQEIDFSDGIEKLEVKKYSLYLNFINDLINKSLQVPNLESNSFRKTTETYSKIFKAQDEDITADVQYNQAKDDLLY